MDSIGVALADVIRALFTNPAHIALLVSLAANVAMGWFITIIRKENRVDWRDNTEALKAVAGTLDKIRMILAVEFKNHDV
jgi:hypothetical protein